MYCKRCGSNIDNDSQFCVVCGNSVSPKSKMPKRDKVVLVVLAIFNFFIAFFFAVLMGEADETLLAFGFIMGFILFFVLTFAYILIFKMRMRIRELQAQLNKTDK